MAMSDLTPEERAEAARQIKKLLLGAEPGDEEEIFYYLSPFPEDREVTDEANDKTGKPGDGHTVSDSGKKQVKR
jgi:hypothetical protein